MAALLYLPLWQALVATRETLSVFVFLHAMFACEMALRGPALSANWKTWRAAEKKALMIGPCFLELIYGKTSARMLRSMWGGTGLPRTSPAPPFGLAGAESGEGRPSCARWTGRINRPVKRNDRVKKSFGRIARHTLR